MGARHKTNLLARQHRHRIQNVGIQVEQAPYCGAKPGCHRHQRVPCLEFVDGADVEQLAVVYAIKHTWRQYQILVSTFIHGDERIMKPPSYATMRYISRREHHITSDMPLRKRFAKSKAQPAEDDVWSHKTK